jgi:hypothetical protein
MDDRRKKLRLKRMKERSVPTPVSKPKNKDVKRNVMSKARAEKLARQMVKRSVSAFSGKYTVASLFNGNKLMTDSAYTKVRKAFLTGVIASKKYPALERIYAEEKLGARS